MRRFLAGVRALAEGLGFVAARPPLWGWAAVPVVLMAFGIGAVAWAVWFVVPGWFTSILAPPEIPALFALYWGLVGYVMLVLFAAGVVIAWALSTLLATPFYDVLAARVDDEIAGRPAAPLDAAAVLGDAARSIGHTLLAGLVFGAAGAVVSLLALIPVVDLLVPLVELALTVVFVARELLDFPLSRRRLGFVAKLAFLRDHAAPFCGLAAAATALLWVPVLNLVVMPAAVVGATLLVARIEAISPPTPA